MDSHRCKLCFRKFSNGRALGGHMRSHMMNLRIPPQQALPPVRSLSYDNDYVSESDTLSSSSTPFSTSQEILMDEAFHPTLSSSLVTLQDRESETESFMKTTTTTTNNPTRKRRSKRMIHKVSSSSTSSDHPHYYYHTCDNVEPDPPRSSVSDVTSDEDLAFCLMMLSRDKWTGKSSTRASVERKFKCGSCNKYFKSYQALGGHRASHKKIRVDKIVRRNDHDLSNEDDEKEEELVANKVHECPVCFRVFASGQALGGHKRSHVLVAAAAHGGNLGISSSLKKVIGVVNDGLIDLNLPAPVDDEDDSAVSDFHF